MKSRRKRGRQAPSSRQKTAAKTAGDVPRNLPLVAQPHGGALLPGGQLGNVGGPGRPPSVIRARLRGSFDQRVEILENIADGEVMQKAEIALWQILEYAKCPKCNIKLEANDPATLLLTTITAKVSAGPKDRIASIKLMGDLGLGPDKELTIEAVRERIQKMLEILRGEFTSVVMKRLEPKLKAVWTSSDRG